LSLEAYWALNRTVEAQKAAMDGSRNYGVFRDNGEQVACARAVTDAVTFAWICDVFVDKSVRGKGIGKALVGSVCAELESLGITRTILATEDAQDLYRRFGFNTFASTGNWMLKLS
jgi:N-acetylglutamate synthase-like GNAT family acetyltransferase